MATVAIREYGLLAKAPTSLSSLQGLDRQVIPASAWNWLMSEACGDGEHKQLVRPRKASGQLYLQVLNYVGVVTTPCGTQIEVVPKISESSEESSLNKGRRLLTKMLNRVYGLKMRGFEQAQLQVFSQPFPEILIAHFLSEVKQLIRRGVRSDYRSLRAEVPYLRGRLQVAEQLRQSPGKQHHFRVEYDEFIPDRPENRILHSSLKVVLSWSKSTVNQRFARELLFVFDGIPVSTNHRNDLSRWQTDRTMQHYRNSKPWCELILKQQTPFSLSGAHFGQSFLFPMNELFEKYVARILDMKLSVGYELREQAASQYLVDSHNNRRLFQLKPDLLITKVKKPFAVLDCKWKLLDQNKNHSVGTKEKTYGINQGDMYQLYAYGKKYLTGSGSMFLVYPLHNNFNQSIPPFEFDDQLSLYAIAFDMDRDRFVVAEDNPFAGLVS